MKKYIKKLVSLLIIGGILSLGLQGCKESDSEKKAVQIQHASSEAEKTIETLTIAIGKDENSLSPFTYVSGTGLIVNRLIYDTLLISDPDGNIVPWMVEDNYKVSKDNRIFTFTLKPGQKFHTGEPVTSEDVKFSFEYPVDKNTAALRKIAKKIEKIETPDERTVIFTLKAPDLTFERDGFAYMRIISSSFYGNIKDPSKISDSIGSGMYKLLEYKTGEYYKLQAVDGYFRGDPKVRNINMPIVKDATAMQQGLLAGQFAATTSNINIEAVSVFEKKIDTSICASPGYSPSMLNFNNGNAILSQKKMRQAIAYGIDIKAISNALYGKYAKLGTRGLIRSDQVYSQSGLEYGFDRKKAVQLLEELGYKEVNREGYRVDGEGRMLSFEILTYAGNTIRSRMAELVAAHLKEIGVRISIKSMEMDTVDAYVWPDFEVSKGRNYEMATWSWSNTNTPTFLLSLCSSNFDIGIYNVMGYKNPVFDQIVLNKYDKVLDMESMTIMLQKLQNIVAEDVPAIVIAYPDSLQVCNTKQYSGWKTGKGLNIVNVFSFIG